MVNINAIAEQLGVNREPLRADSLDGLLAIFPGTGNRSSWQNLVNCSLKHYPTLDDAGLTSYLLARAKDGELQASESAQSGLSVRVDGIVLRSR